MARKFDAPREYLLECFSIHNNQLYWNERPLEHFKTVAAHKCFNTRFANKLAGWINGEGYTKILLNKTGYKAHRIIWCMREGYWPEEDIDHLDHDKQNNSRANLREVSRADNTRNRSKRIDNKSGVTGVHQAGNNFIVKVCGQYLGRFKTLAEATAARQLAKSNSPLHSNHG